MTDMLPMDIHSHSENSYDADYPVLKMCEAAVKAGLAVYAITDHYDISALDEGFGQLDLSLKKSIADISLAKEFFQDKIQILAGVELGQPLEKPDKAAEVLSAFPYDFVLGSLHNAPGRLDIYFYDLSVDSRALDEELEAYFRHLLELIRWGRFDSAAHISYPFRFITERQKKPYPFSRWDDYLETALNLLAEKGLALEINTSGLRKSPSYLIPEARWIKRFRELGGEKLTLGADAHSPRYVGAGIAEGAHIAAEAGFNHLCYFVQREARYISLRRE